MKRERIDNYIPNWEADGWEAGVYRRYAQKLIQKDAWKYANLGLTEDDLMQEAWMSFDYCVKKYKVKHPKHFMTLYKKRLFCQFWLLSKKSSKENLRIRDEEQVTEALSSKGKHEYNLGPLKILLERAPDEIKEVLNVLVNSPSEMVDELFMKKRINNSDICKLLGYDPKKKIIQSLGYEGEKKKQVEKMNLLDIFKDYFQDMQKS